MVWAAQGPLAELTLFVELPWDRATIERRSRFLEIVRAIAHDDQAIVLRIAQVLAWIKARDVNELGYPGWDQFCAEHSPWEESRTREYLRLVESSLHLVREAASQKRISLTLATRAPRELGDSADALAQAAWLESASLSSAPKRRPRQATEVVRGKDMRVVEDGRVLTERLMGRASSPQQMDRWAIAQQAEGHSGKEIVEAARAKPPIPDRLGKIVPPWESDPAVSLLGPWVEPASLPAAIDLLRDLQALLAGRTVLLGMAYQLIQVHELWKFGGWESLKQFCSGHLEIEQWTFQRYARDGSHHFMWPAVRAEVEAGLTMDRARFATDKVWGKPEALEPWLDLARRMGRTELGRAKQLEDLALDAYRPAVEMAAEVERRLTTGIVGDLNETANRIAMHVVAAREDVTEIVGGIRVALREGIAPLPPRPTPASMVVVRGAFKAYEWLLATVRLPRPYGVRGNVVRDRYICQNPRCRRCTIRVHPHHIVPQLYGDDDDPSNIVTLCPACHLRGIHSYWMSVVRIDDWLVWSWPDGGVVLMWSPR